MALSNAEPMAMPEPMNASPHHSKVKVSITLADRMYVAGGHIAGKVEMECRADKGLGIGIIMVELFATQELTSRDHSATSTFIHSKRIFQGPGLPPSNAVQAHPLPGNPVLPPSYYQARRGLSTFLFRIPVPEGSPSSITFGSGVAKVRYELRASVGVVWKGERRLVVDKQSVDVVADYPYDEIVGLKEPEGVVIGENGKFWVHGKLVGPVVVAGESACIELHVKNHSNKKNTGLSLSLDRTLILPGASRTGIQTLELTDTLTHVPFRGAEYIVPPGAEGVANLVFDIPKHSRGVRAGTLEGDEVDPPRYTDSLFEIRCTVEIKMTMGFGNKDLMLSVPVSIVHPKVVPQRQLVPPPGALSPPVAGVYIPPQLTGPYGYEMPYSAPHAYTNPAYPALAMSPPPLHPAPFALGHQPWISPAATGLPPLSAPPPHSYATPDIYSQQLYQPPVSPVPQTYMVTPPIPPYLNRPASAGGNVSLRDPYTLPVVQTVSGLPPPSVHTLEHVHRSMSPSNAMDMVGAEEGKGQRALRVSHHLRISSRTRSVSPQSHRFPLPPVPFVSAAVDLTSDLERHHHHLDSLVVSSPPRLRVLPLPPGPAPPLSPSMRVENGSLSPTASGGLVHSPRPQLTPKHSYTRDARPKSERVEELERLANIIAAQTKDLSKDISTDDIFAKPNPAGGVSKADDKKKEGTEEESPEVNKTLPAPPVPTRNKPAKPAKPAALASLRPRSGLETMFDPPLALEPSKPERGLLHHHAAAASPPPVDRTPRTPTLSAMLPTRYPRTRSSKFLGEEKSENGLDALERKLLAQVGTWKAEEVQREAERRPGYIMDGEEGDDGIAGMRIAPINIPVKVQSPEPLNDSAISSLTLGNHGIEEALENDHGLGDGDLHEHGRAGLPVGLGLGLSGGNDSDVDVEAKTHRGGSVSDDERRTSWNPPSFPLFPEGGGKLHVKSGTRHRREEAETAFQGSTPTKLSNESGRSGRSKDKERRSGKKKDKGGKEERTKTRSEAKGRVAAWLGRIDPEQPPEEPSIPPSPSVSLHPEHALGSLLPEVDVLTQPQAPEAEKIHEEKDVSTAPNPRSSGFMPIGTLRRDTVQRIRPVRDTTVAEESRKVADLWATELPLSENAVASSPKDQATPKIPVTTPNKPAPQPIRGDREAALPSEEKVDNKAPLRRTPVPISGSRNVWQLPEPAAAPSIKSKARAPVPTPTKTVVPARLHALPPSQNGDPEVKYDVRSARGGRGGKVASVTAMWASVAAGISTSQSQGSSARKDANRAGEAKLNHNGRFAAETSSQHTKSPGPSLPGKIALPGLASGNLRNGPKSPLASAARAVPLPSRTELAKLKPTLEQSEPREDPARVSKKLSATKLHLPKPVVGAISSSKSTESLKSSPAPGLFAGDFKSRTPGKTTPTTNLSTPSSSERVLSKDSSAASRPKINGGTKSLSVSTKPVVKALSVPAVISSSHAIPVLSSTASLARPVGSTTAAPRVTTKTRVAAAAGGGKAGSGGVNGAGGVKSYKVDHRAFGASVPPRLAAVGEVVATLPSSSIMSPPAKSPPPPDLAFGQARLRDLIKKYQAQAS